jgi:hypothetical protein
VHKIPLLKPILSQLNSIYNPAFKLFKIRFSIILSSYKRIYFISGILLQIFKLNISLYEGLNIVTRNAFKCNSWKSSVLAMIHTENFTNVSVQRYFYTKALCMRSDTSLNASLMTEINGDVLIRFLDILWIISFPCFKQREPCSSVSIVSGYGQDDRAIGLRSPA